MADLTPSLNDLLQRHNAHRTRRKGHRPPLNDEFLKEAYTIVWYPHPSVPHLLTTLLPEHPHLLSQKPPPLRPPCLPTRRPSTAIPTTQPTSFLRPPKDTRILHPTATGATRRRIQIPPPFPARLDPTAGGSRNAPAGNRAETPAAQALAAVRVRRGPGAMGGGRR